MQGTFIFKKKLNKTLSENEFNELESEYDFSDVWSYDYDENLEHFCCRVDVHSCIVKDDDEPNTLVLSVDFDTESKCDSEKDGDGWEDWYTCDDPDDLVDDVFFSVERMYPDWEFSHKE